MSTFSRLYKTACPAAVAIIAGAYYYRKELHSVSANIVDFHNSPSTYIQQHSLKSSGYYNETYTPLTCWNFDWDNREPITLVDQKKFEAATEEEKVEMLKNATATATRHIFLIRHGQYHYNKETKNLTNLGREQAITLGKRLDLSNIKFDKVIFSTMTRATETAQLMLQQMNKDIPAVSDSIIEEGAPYPPEPNCLSWKPQKKEFFTDGSRIEAAFRKYIHRAHPKQKKDSYEIIVCHGNVIRYFICRALQFPPEGWLRFSIGHTSITWLTIRPNGLVSLRSYGDIGHLPPDKLTFS